MSPASFLRSVMIVVALACGLACQGPDWLLDPSSYVAQAERDSASGALRLDNGLLELRLVVDGRLALVGIAQRTAHAQMLRGAAGLGAFTLDGTEVAIGGVTGAPDRAFLTPEWIAAATALDGAFVPVGTEITAIAPRLEWKRTRPAAPDAVWPPKGLHLAIRCAPPAGKWPGVEVTVHVELYDGIPMFAHWLELKNGGERAVEVDSFTSLRLPVVEAESRVEPQRLGVRLPNLYAETDYAFHAMTGADGSSHCVRWLPDPDFHTQVNYQKQTLCLLEVKPDIGPAQTVAPGATFATFRTFVLAPDREDRERESLAQRRMYRILAPWSTENPLMMHVRNADPDAVKDAIQQCADVGFEMAILTFGSGFEVEDDSRENLDRWKDLADFAHKRGVQLGGYSLLSSRRIQPDEDNCIDKATGKPGGQVFGFAPALASDWGQRYFAKLYRFYEYTGFDLLEHDGSYPGDSDAAARPPLQKGWDDSRWVQFSIIRDFYRWCRARGVYLNVPDWYFLQGSSKTGMGYRETNWSLPRAQQVLHARQNLFDGTRDKNPAMGWMFVPLTEYHGGGAAATVEPLYQHLDHYEAMILANLAYGAQACYRGPRLFDTDKTKALVKKWVAWYKQYRDILESDVIHSSSRRADGRDLDWVLHCNARCATKAMLVVWNPTDAEVKRSIPIDLYYAGLVDHAQATGEDGVTRDLALDRFSRTAVDVVVPANGAAWFAIR